MPRGRANKPKVSEPVTEEPNPEKKQAERKIKKEIKESKEDGKRKLSKKKSDEATSVAKAKSKKEESSEDKKITKVSTKKEENKKSKADIDKKIKKETTSSIKKERSNGGKKLARTLSFSESVGEVIFDVNDGDEDKSVDIQDECEKDKKTVVRKKGGQSKGKSAVKSKPQAETKSESKMEDTGKDETGATELSNSYPETYVPVQKGPNKRGKSTKSKKGSNVQVNDHQEGETLLDSALQLAIDESECEKRSSVKPSKRETTKQKNTKKIRTTNRKPEPENEENNIHDEFSFSNEERPRHVHDKSEKEKKTAAKKRGEQSKVKSNPMRKLHTDMKSESEDIVISDETLGNQKQNNPPKMQQRTGRKNTTLKNESYIPNSSNKRKTVRFSDVYNELGNSEFHKVQQTSDFIETAKEEEISEKGRDKNRDVNVDETTEEECSKNDEEILDTDSIKVELESDGNVPISNGNKDFIDLCQPSITVEKNTDISQVDKSQEMADLKESENEDLNSTFTVVAASQTEVSEVGHEQTTEQNNNKSENVQPQTEVLMNEHEHVTEQECLVNNNKSENDIQSKTVQTEHLVDQNQQNVPQLEQELEIADKQGRKKIANLENNINRLELQIKYLEEESLADKQQLQTLQNSSEEILTILTTVLNSHQELIERVYKLEDKNNNENPCKNKIQMESDHICHSTEIDILWEKSQQQKQTIRKLHHELDKARLSRKAE